MWFYSETSVWFPLSKSIFLLLDAACLVEIDWLIDYYLTSSEQYFRVAHIFSFLCCPFVCLYVFSSVLWYPLRFPHRNDVRFVFTSSCMKEGACLIYVICVCFAFNVVQHIMLCFCLFFFVLYTLHFVYCQFLWTVLFWLPLRYSLMFIKEKERLLIKLNLII